MWFGTLKQIPGHSPRLGVCTMANQAYMPLWLQAHSSLDVYNVLFWISGYTR